MIFVWYFPLPLLDSRKRILIFVSFFLPRNVALNFDQARLALFSTMKPTCPFTLHKENILLQVSSHNNCLSSVHYATDLIFFLYFLELINRTDKELWSVSTKQKCGVTEKANQSTITKNQYNNFHKKWMLQFFAVAAFKCL